MLGVPLCLYLAVRSYRAEAALFSGQRHPVAQPPMSPELSGLESVVLSGAEGARLAAWYVPSHNRAAVLLAHGTGGDRSSLLPEARLLARHGFGVLLFDFPGHGESEGSIHWGGDERTALRAALDFVAARSDVDAHRIGALGFSMGGLVVAQVAADERRIGALALLGAPSDIEQQTRHEYRKWGPLTVAPALLALRRHGVDFAHAPVDVIARVSPRPLLLVTGERDEVVLPAMAHALYAAARAPKQMLTVQGVGHGGYTERQDFAVRLVAFFADALGVQTT